MKTILDSSVLIPYFARGYYAERLEREQRTGRAILSSVVAEEVLAGARDQEERRTYDRFFADFRRAGLIVTPDDAAWHRCGTLLSRYRERYGDIDVRDHQNDVLIVLAAIQLARDEEVVVLTENEAHTLTWLSFLKQRRSLRVEPARRT